jgi:peptide/nickel transport system permease protein
MPLMDKAAAGNLESSRLAVEAAPGVEVPGETTVVPAPRPTELELEEAAEREDPLGQLSYRQLVWRRLRKSKLGLVGGTTLVLFYLVAIFAEFFAPYHYTTDNIRLRYVPPQHVHLTSRGIYLYGLKQARDPETLEIVYKADPARRFPVRLFHRGDPYVMFGLIRSNVHLFGSRGPLFLFGTDRMGRDLLSRIIFGARVSLTVGLVGVILTLLIGSALGTASGYWGGAADMAVQRLVELLSAFPAIPLWMALAAALPPTWSSIQIYFAITVILSLLSWGGLARQVRGKVLAMREADFVLAARSVGAGPAHIIFRHLLPTCYSHIIVIATLAIPGMILGETALSFLGLGIRPPMTSWGVLLEEAQRVTVVLHFPWLLIPAVPVLIVVIAFNFLGDALRDAADPYAG